MSRTCWVATGCSVITFETAGGGVVNPEPNQPILIGTADLRLNRHAQAMCNRGGEFSDRKP